MRLLIVDNYDSFTFNLYQLAADVFGTVPVVIRNDDPWEAIVDQRFDAAIISPGPGTPEKDEDFGVSRKVISEMDIPVLGVCLGHQGICHLAGASIIHAPEPVHGRESDIFHDGTGLFHGIPNPFRVVRYHSLVASEPLPGCLEKTAWTEDGLLMAVAHKSRPVWGVQFHPESICSTFGRQLIENFRAVAAARLAARGEQETLPVSAASTVSEEGQPEGTTITRTQRKLYVRRAPLEHNTAELFERAFSTAPYAFWLDSSLTRETDARFSFMGGYAEHEVECVRYFAHNRRLSIQHGVIEELSSEDLFGYLKRRIASISLDSPDLPFEFRGGFVGYFGYELKALCGGTQAHRSPHPDCYQILADHFVAVDHATNEMYLVFIGDAEAESQASAWFDKVQADMERKPLCPSAPYHTDETLRFVPSQSKSRYIRSIERCLEAIKDGETYEVCLTNQLSAATSINGFEYYKRLRMRNPAPYSSFLKFPELTVASSSPERFLKMTSDRVVESKPIKGTVRRGTTQQEDEVLKRSLAEDEKSHSENLMIVDLLRNDLGRVCTIGSVSVPKLMHVETYATVHQLVSTIQGTLGAGHSIVDCLSAAFPGGSMTGAPKVRTMEIIDELEGQARGVYSGSIGFLSFNGSADLNIVIRTAVFSRSKVTIGVGGAIIALSDPQEEWAEILLKAKALLSTFESLTKSTVLSVNDPRESYGKAFGISKRVG